MLSRTVRRVALGATVAATSLTGLASTAHADGCVEIDETISKVAATGDVSVSQVWSIVDIPRPLNLSTTSGRGYQLGDGTILWLSEAEWWELLDKAVADEQWQHANHDLLVAVGILESDFVFLPAIKSIELTKRYQFCEPTWDPYEHLDWPVVQVQIHWLGDGNHPDVPGGDSGSDGDPRLR